MSQILPRCTSEVDLEVTCLVQKHSHHREVGSVKGYSVIWFMKFASMPLYLLLVTVGVLSQKTIVIPISRKGMIIQTDIGGNVMNKMTLPVHDYTEKGAIHLD